MYHIGRNIRWIYKFSIVKALLYRESKLKRHVNGIAMRLSNSLNTIYLMTITMIDDFILERAPILGHYFICLF